MTTSTTRSWRSIVEEADKDFRKESTQPVAYKFSNGREFRQPIDVYGTSTGTGT